MPRRRTTLVLEDSTYTKLVEQSLRRFGTPRAVSKVVDIMVEESTAKDPRAREKGILKLLYSKKVARTTSKEFERDRTELSRRFEKIKRTS
jgi:hypothetical protein